MIAKASVLLDFTNSDPLEFPLSDAMLEEVNRRVEEGSMPTGNSCLRLEFGPKIVQAAPEVDGEPSEPYCGLKPGDTCPKCGGVLLLKDKTQYGPFIGCSNFRDKNCRFTIPLDKDDPEDMRRYKEWKLNGITGFDKLPVQRPAPIVHPAPIEPPEYSAEANQEVDEAPDATYKPDTSWL